MSTYAIGDIHGCAEELRALVGLLRLQENLHPWDDTLVFVGDYIDRGPDSKGVIDYLIGLDQIQKCVFLMGNHEEMMMHYLKLIEGDEEYARAWPRPVNGGVQTILSYGAEESEVENFTAQDIPSSHVDFLRGLVYYYIEDSILFVHAGIGLSGYGAKTPEEAVARSTENELTWIRPNYNSMNNFGTIVHGHTPREDGNVWWHPGDEGRDPYRVNIDTGVVYGAGPLTAVRTSDWKVIHV